MSKELGENIRRLRKQAGLRQYQLSMRLNVTAQTVSSWECGRTEPNMGQIEQMRRMFGCEMSEFLRGTKNHVLPDDRVLIDAYHDAPEEVKDAIRTLLHIKSEKDIKWYEDRRR